MSIPLYLCYSTNISVIPLLFLLFHNFCYSTISVQYSRVFFSFCYSCFNKQAIWNKISIRFFPICLFLTISDSCVFLFNPVYSDLPPGDARQLVIQLHGAGYPLQHNTSVPHQDILDQETVAKLKAKLFPVNTEFVWWRTKQKAKLIAAKKAKLVV